jgi:hypothetical protein
MARSKPAYADQFLTAKEGKGIVSKERWGTLTPDHPHQ